MNYNELYLLIKQKGFTVKSICNQIEMTSNGFKDAIEKQTLPWIKIEKLCSILDVTPNDLLGWPVVQGNGNYATNISGVNTQNSNEAILTLREELRDKSSIIKEKDKQINRLLAIIEKWKRS